MFERSRSQSPESVSSTDSDDSIEPEEVKGQKIHLNLVFFVTEFIKKCIAYNEYMSLFLV